MSTLESIVPPLELCYKIGVNDFADSALVWNTRCSPDKILLIRREGWDHGGYITPAPTLAEIMEALATFGNCFLRKDETDWMVMIEMPGDDEGYGYAAKVEHDKDDPATAALRLWLELKERKEENA